MQPTSTLAQDRLFFQVGDFVGDSIQRTAHVIVEGGLTLAEEATLLLLQRTAQTAKLGGLAQSKAPAVLHMFTAARKAAPILPFITGRVAARSTTLALIIGFRAARASIHMLTAIARK